MNILKKITAVFLAAVFLLSSLGFTINSMVCLKSGKGKVSLSAIEDCCPKKKEDKIPSSAGTILKKGCCCDMSSFTIKLKDFHAAQKLAIDQPVLLSSLFVSPGSVRSYAFEQKLTVHCADLPPPCSGRQLLSFISTLII